MIRRRLFLISGIFFAVFLIFSLIYTRPMTLSQLCPGIDIQQISALHGYYQYETEDLMKFYCTTEEERFTEIKEQFASRTFRRSLKSLVPNFLKPRKWHQIQEGDFFWTIIFEFDDLIIDFNGDLVGGDLITIKNYYDQLEIYFVDTDTYWHCTTSDQETLYDTIIVLLAQI